MNNMAKNLRVIRTRKKLRQVDLAFLSGVSQSSISQIEGGHKKSPSVWTITKLCKALKVSSKELIES